MAVLGPGWLTPVAADRPASLEGSVHDESNYVRANPQLPILTASSRWKQKIFQQSVVSTSSGCPPDFPCSRRLSGNLTGNFDFSRRGPRQCESFPSDISGISGIPCYRKQGIHKRITGKSRAGTGKEPASHGRDCSNRLTRRKSGAGAPEAPPHPLHSPIVADVESIVPAARSPQSSPALASPASTARWLASPGQVIGRRSVFGKSGRTRLSAYLIGPGDASVNKETWSWNRRS